MIWLVLYLLVFIGIGAIDYIHSRKFDQYVVAGRNQSGLFVTMSLLATVLGASSTIGLIERAYGMGFPAFWWLGVGVIGLVLQAIWITRKVHSIKAYTLPDLAHKTIGASARGIIAGIIAVSWIGIIAAQFVAASAMISFITGLQAPTLILILTAGAIVLYSILGGQISILKTDLVQGIILLFAIGFTLLWLLFSPSPDRQPIRVELFNSQFGLLDFIYLLVIAGATFLIGPDMFSRVFTARSQNTARRAVLFSALILLIMSFLITLIGVWAGANLPGLTKQDIIYSLLNVRLPRALSLLLAFGLLSAIVSSADTCLVTTAAIIEKDILGRERTWATRIWLAVIGVAAILIALVKPDIIGLLLFAYSIYTPGVVVPLFIAIRSYQHRELRIGVLLVGMVVGGTLGLAAKILEMTSNIAYYRYLALVGIGLSLVFGLAAIKRRNSCVSLQE